MASPYIDYCEQLNPEALKQVQPFQNATRIHNSLLARAEKRGLIWMARRVPDRINSDHLTLLGFVAQMMAGLSYALARADRMWLLAAIAFLVLNWLGDSLDGTLARVRQQQRPRYGFYVDHILDSFGSVALMAGLGASGYMHPYIATGLLIAFLLLSIQSYLATYTLGEFQLSFWSFGPTELRLLLMAGNLAALRWPMVYQNRFRLFDLAGLIGIIAMIVMLIFFSMRNTIRLYNEERVQ